MTVFHFEMPRPDELGTALTEANLVSAACKLAGHRFHSFAPVNKRQLQEQLDYLFEWEPKNPEKPQFSLHFSNHANGDGLQVGSEFIEWSDFASAIGHASSGKDYPYMLVVSACGRGRPDFTAAFTGARNPPIYVFAFEDEVTWQDAAHASSLLYRFLPDVPVLERQRVQQIINRVRELGFGSLLYFRRDGDKYKVYPKDRS